LIGERGARQVDALVSAERQRRALEEVVLTPGGAKIITLFPAQELPIANKLKPTSCCPTSNLPFSSKT
jgi:hypothetical protein